MGREYYSVEDKMRRLHNTICLYKGEPIFVSANEYHGNTVGIQALAAPTSKQAVVEYTEEDFDYKSFCLGYMNFSSHAVYLSRRPDRQNRQGLSFDTMHQDPYIYHPRDFMRTQALVDCMKGVYPTIEQAIENVMVVGWNSSAFARRLAIESKGGNVLLVHRGRPIAQKKYGTFEFMLMPTGDYSYLKDMLIKQGVPLC